MRRSGNCTGKANVADLVALFLRVNVKPILLLHGIMLAAVLTLGELMGCAAWLWLAVRWHWVVFVVMLVLSRLLARGILGLVQS